MAKLTDARTREIADLAEGYAVEHFPDSWIDPAQLIDRLGVTVSYNRYGSAFDGLLEWKKPYFHIYCNLDRVESSTSARARFTLGHELGHLLIDEHRNAMISGKAPSCHPSFADVLEPNLKVEAEADLFASNLLMPEARLEKVIPRKENVRKFQQILDVQKNFNVSFQSAAIKVIATAEYAFCACIMWRRDRTPWFRISKGFFASGYRHIKCKSEDLNPYCATALTLADDLHTGFNPHSTVTTASQWFHHIAVGSRNDILLVDTAVHLGRHGVFTFLSWDPDPS